MMLIGQRINLIKWTCGELAEPHLSVLSVASVHGESVQDGSVHGESVQDESVDRLFFHPFKLLGIF
jgi:hypothetical protein